MQNKELGTRSGNVFSRILKFLIKNKIYIGILIGILSFLFVFVSFDQPFMKKPELVSLEGRFKNFHGKAKASDRCIVIGVDKESIKNIGRWPWNRNIYAELIEALNFYGVASVSFDLFFILPNEKDPDGDKIFADTVAKYDNVIIGDVIGFEYPDSYYTKEDYEKVEAFGVEHKGYLSAVSLKELEEKDKAISDGQALFVYKPYKALLDSVKTIGLVNIGGNKEQGKIYSYPLLVNFDDIYLPNLALATYLNYAKTKKVDQVKNLIVINDLKVPLDNESKYFINWYPSIKKGFPKPYDKMSFYEVLKAYRTVKIVSEKTALSMKEVQEKIDEIFKYDEDEELPPELEAFTEEFPDDAVIFPSNKFSKKFAFVGVTDESTGTQDLISTLLIDLMPGVYLHANVMDNFLQKDFIKEVPRNITFLIMFILCVLTGATVLGLKDLRLAIGFGLLFCFYFTIPIALFYFYNINADLTRTQGAIAFTFLCSVVLQWILVDKDKQLFKNTFSNYLSPQIMNEILTDPSKVELGGDKKDITILFSDIRGFTTISEQSTPEEVVQFLNEYFDAMVDEVIKTDGTVDKFIGDAIMAFWGAPVERENHQN